MMERTDTDKELGVVLIIKMSCTIKHQSFLQGSVALVCQTRKQGPWSNVICGNCCLNMWHWTVCFWCQKLQQHLRCKSTPTGVLGDSYLPDKQCLRCLRLMIATDKANHLTLIFSEYRSIWKVAALQPVAVTGVTVEFRDIIDELIHCITISSCGGASNYA